jgi:hypothetical protein
LDNPTNRSEKHGVERTSMGRALCVEDLISRIAPIPLKVDLEDLVSSNVPPGYQTVGGYWAQQEPEAFEFLTNPVASLTEHAEKLELMCLETDTPIVQVEPSPLARSLGFLHSRAFPITLLCKFYGSGNP